MRKIKELWSWLKWGRLREETKDTLDGYIVLEYAVYSCRTGQMVGYWAYGHFDPSMPYRGQPAVWSRP